MAKMSIETDEARLTKKVADTRSGSEKSQGDAEFRALRKHLKRVQRKRRRLALRKQHAMSKKPAAATSQPAAGSA